MLLRGINLPRHKRVSMPALRDLLAGAGFGNVVTHVQSGNVVLDADGDEIDVAERCQEAIWTGLGLEVECVVRGRGGIEQALARDPFGSIAANPARYLVVFFRERAPAGLEQRLRAAAVEEERFAVAERELYLWLPASVQRSRLWGLNHGAGATARNWTTVLALGRLLAARP